MGQLALHFRKWHLFRRAESGYAMCCVFQLLALYWSCCTLWSPCCTVVECVVALLCVCWIFFKYTNDSSFVFVSVSGINHKRSVRPRSQTTDSGLLCTTGLCNLSVWVTKRLFLRESSHQSLIRNLWPLWAGKFEVTLRFLVSFVRFLEPDSHDPAATKLLMISKLVHDSKVTVWLFKPPGNTFKS